MRILYLSFSYLPSRRANSVHVVKMCAALAGRGHRVELVGKRPRDPELCRADVAAHYGVEPTFAIRTLVRPAIRGGELVYASRVALLLLRSREVDLVYCRYPLGAWMATRLGLPTVYEMHGLRTARWSRALLRSVLASGALRRLVLVSGGLERAMRDAGLLPATDRYVVAHDAADPPPAEPAARRGPVAEGEGERPGMALGYVGGFYAGRGLELMAAIASRLPQSTFHLIGGDAARLAEILGAPVPPNMVCHGYVPHSRVSGYYGLFDVLLMPYQQHVAVASGGIDTGDWMSPLKLFEYMATGLPIVSSDLPVLREVLAHERNALLVPPDDPEAWVTALRRLADDAGLRHRLGEAARCEQRQRYTWAARAERVLSGLEGAR